MEKLQAFFENNHLSYQTISYLLEEAKELEQLKLDIHRLTDNQSVDCHIRIIEAERFITLLTRASCLS